MPLLICTVGLKVLNNYFVFLRGNTNISFGRMVGFEPGLQLAGMPSSVAGSEPVRFRTLLAGSHPVLTNVTRQTVFEKSYNFFYKSCFSQIKLVFFKIRYNYVVS